MIHQLRNLAKIAILFSLLPGCVMVRLDNIESEPNFNWDVLKRDQIVMTPLLDLRPSQSQAMQPFFTRSEQEAYAELFKQEFFKWRKDIRVFGAGGAFEKLKNMPNLTELAEKILNKESLTAVETESLKAATQDIRFVLFLSMPSEKLSHKFHTYKDKEFLHKVYSSRREFQVKVALYDLKESRVPWIGTKILSPTNVNDIKIALPKAKKDRAGFTFFEDFSSYSWDTDQEKYPNFPDREPALSSSFDDFALSLPLNPSEDKLIEYESFTYHRPEAGLLLSTLGKSTSVHLDLGFSSLIYKKLRLGALLGLPVTRSRVAVEQKTFELDSVLLALTTDYEVTLSDKWRLLSGAYLGTELFKIYDERKSELKNQTEHSEGDPGETDATLFVWPRVKFLYGATTGFNFGIAAFYRNYWGIEETELSKHKPSPWAIELSFAGTFRGF